ncbi:MAG: polysaccharide pyruvyl transferase family protein [Nitrospirae bacterium]|nr:polysaccharide pyruvyl transferase family protein [Nitrospirota bacterium]
MMLEQGKARTVAVVGGGWSTNVGNGFYNLGTLHVLKTIFPNDRIFLFSDQEANWDYRRHQTPKNSIRLLDHITPDYLVLHGCFLSSSFPGMWNPTFQRLKEKGTKVLFISAGLTHYTDFEVEVCRNYLRRNPPYLFLSRDAVTYSKFNDLVEFSYNGIDTAFFVSEAFPPVEMDFPPYVILNFDKLPEPVLSIENGRGRDHGSAQAAVATLERRMEFEHADTRWSLEFPLVRYKLSNSLGKFYKYFEAALLPERNAKTKVGPFTIIRTDHQSNPWFVRKMYRAPNSFAWDLPEPYLALYANTALTLSDRVHACVASLAYGRPAMLFSRSPRSLILDRVGAKDIKHKPLSVSGDQLQFEKEKMMDFLQHIPL